MLVKDAVDAYLISRRAAGLSGNTLRTNASHLRRFARITGPIQVTTINVAHLDAALSAASVTLCDASLNNYQNTLSLFFDYCRARRWMHRDVDPLVGKRMRKVPPKDRRRIHVSQFETLLDACAHPRDRMVVALGLYLFLRAGEITSLRLSDVDLDASEVRVTVHKTKDLDYMPICAELDAELRRWLTWYATHAGPLDGDFFLVPALAISRVRCEETGKYRPTADGEPRLQPNSRLRRPERVVNAVLPVVGIPVTDDFGRPVREGCHTLRRSGARALFDQLAAAGYDGALQELKAWLHHKHSSMTEHYLGLNVERRKRDLRAKGRPMFVEDPPTKIGVMAI